MVYIDEHGEHVAATHEIARMFERPAISPVVSPVIPATLITVQPTTILLKAETGLARSAETITVTITKEIPASQPKARHLLPRRHDRLHGQHPGRSSGWLEYYSRCLERDETRSQPTATSAIRCDFESSDPYAFHHQVSLTNGVAPVIAAINTWSATGGGDIPEADLFGLDSVAVPPGGTIGWRSGSKRIIVWFGDAPGHDPICPAVSGGAAITEASVTAKLLGEGIAVLAISTANPGLDDDPKSGATGYVAKCRIPRRCTRRGNPYCRRLTPGKFVAGINAATIVNTIISLVSAAVGSINNVKLVPTAGITAFVTSITPAAGYGPLPGDKDHTLNFNVTFTGAVPCTAQAQVFSGTLDVVADGKVVASKTVEITVPACMVVYSVNFVCGEQSDCGCECTPVQPGRYATEVNIHNYGLKPVDLIKRFIPVVLAGAPIGREPRVSAVRTEDRITLPPQTATMDDCCRISGLLMGGDPPSSMPLTIGLLEITATAEVAVTAVYTTSGPKHGGVSIRTKQIARR